MSITHRDNSGISKHEKHLRLLSSGTKLFITFELKVFRHKERDTDLYYADFFICPPPPSVAPAARPQWASKVNPSSSDTKTQLWLFFKIPKILHTHFSAWRHSHAVVTFSIWGFYCDISEWHVRSAHVNTCAHVCTQLTHALSKRFSAKLNQKARYIKRNPSATILQIYDWVKLLQRKVAMPQKLNFVNGSRQK